MKLNTINKRNHKIMLSAPGGDIYKLCGQCRFVRVRSNVAGLGCLCATNGQCGLQSCGGLSTLPVSATAHSTPGMDGILRLHHKQTRIRISHGSTDDSSLRETDSCLVDKQYLVQV